MNEKDDYLKIIKIGLFGESSMGKNYLARKYCNVNLDYTLSTLGFEYYTTKRNLSNGNQNKIKIYDTAGQERFKSFPLNTIRHSDGIILMYDITNRDLSIQ